MGERWMDRLDLPEETGPLETLVEIAGHRRVLIEHHCGVTEYGRQRICVRVKFGCICVTGEDLKLTRMTKAQLIVSGCIECVSLERKRAI